MSFAATAKLIIVSKRPVGPFDIISIAFIRTYRAFLIACDEWSYDLRSQYDHNHTMDGHIVTWARLIKIAAKIMTYDF